MAREFFKHCNFRADSMALISQCNAVIARYQQQSLRLTLRQLYYQLVSQNIITNEEKSYKRLSNLVSDARLAGMMDWDAIEDRVRQPRKPPEYDSVQDLVDAALCSYRLPRWADQEHYCELWVEKDALAGVLSPIASKYHITLMVNRGYSSQSAMYESATRYLTKTDSGAKSPWLFYLGDHDPSGEDMVRDIETRMHMFGVDGLVVKKIALTMEQVEHYHPPPNPAKVTDPRAKDYIRKHGRSSWEVDALPPEVLRKLIEEALDEVTDWEHIRKVMKQESRDKEALRKAAEQMRGRQRDRP